jgi:hypothetical protein
VPPSSHFLLFLKVVALYFSIIGVCFTIGHVSKVVPSMLALEF